MSSMTVRTGLLLGLLNLAASVGSAMLLRRLGALSEDWQAVVVGMVIFQIGVLIELVIVTAQIVGKERRALDQERLIQGGRQELERIQKALETLGIKAYGAGDLFLEYFRRRLDDVAQRAETAAQKGTLRVVAEHFLFVDNVLDALSGQDDRSWRYTWPLDDSPQLFSELHWRLYFEQTAKMAAKGEITSIRSLLIVSDLDLLNSEAISRLLRFIRGAKNIQCRAITQKQYDVVATDCKLQTRHLDFGIYGNRLIFRSEAFEPEIAGEFSTDVALIDAYIKMFDRIWNSIAIDPIDSVKHGGKLSLRGLLDQDSRAADGAERTDETE